MLQRSLSPKAFQASRLPLFLQVPGFLNAHARDALAGMLLQVCRGKEHTQALKIAIARCTRHSVAGGDSILPALLKLATKADTKPGARALGEAQTRLLDFMYDVLFQDQGETGAHQSIKNLLGMSSAAYQAWAVSRH